MIFRCVGQCSPEQCAQGCISVEKDACRPLAPDPVIVRTSIGQQRTRELMDVGKSLVSGHGRAQRDCSVPGRWRVRCPQLTERSPEEQSS